MVLAATMETFLNLVKDEKEAVYLILGGIGRPRELPLHPSAAREHYKNILIRAVDRMRGLGVPEFAGFTEEYARILPDVTNPVFKAVINLMAAEDLIADQILDHLWKVVLPSDEVAPRERLAAVEAMARHIGESQRSHIALVEYLLGYLDELVGEVKEE